MVLRASPKTDILVILIELKYKTEEVVEIEEIVWILFRYFDFVGAINEKKFKKKEEWKLVIVATDNKEYLSC